MSLLCPSASVADGLDHLVFALQTKKLVSVSAAEGEGGVSYKRAHGCKKWRFTHTDTKLNSNTGKFIIIHAYPSINQQTPWNTVICKVKTNANTDTAFDLGLVGCNFQVVFCSINVCVGSSTFCGVWYGLV